MILFNIFVCILFYIKLQQTIKSVDFSNTNQRLKEIALKNFLLCLITIISTIAAIGLNDIEFYSLDLAANSLMTLLMFKFAENYRNFLHFQTFKPISSQTSS